jgi:hypothetical protein
MTRAEEAGKLLRTEGMVFKSETTGTIHVHPAVKIERESRALFSRIWTQLHFEWWAPIDGAIDDDD